MTSDSAVNRAKELMRQSFVATYPRFGVNFEHFRDQIQEFLMIWVVDYFFDSFELFYITDLLFSAMFFELNFDPFPRKTRILFKRVEFKVFDSFVLTVLDHMKGKISTIFPNKS